MVAHGLAQGQVSRQALTSPRGPTRTAARLRGVPFHLPDETRVRHRHAPRRLHRAGCGNRQTIALSAWRGRTRTTPGTPRTAPFHRETVTARAMIPGATARTARTPCALRCLGRALLGVA